jgi:hypothetical protein
MDLLFALAENKAAPSVARSRRFSAAEGSAVLLARIFAL